MQTYNNRRTPISKNFSTTPGTLQNLINRFQKRKAPDIVHYSNTNININLKQPSIKRITRKSMNRYFYPKTVERPSKPSYNFYEMQILMNLHTSILCASTFI